MIKHVTVTALPANATGPDDTVTMLVTGTQANVDALWQTARTQVAQGLWQWVQFATADGGTL